MNQLYSETSVKRKDTMSTLVLRTLIILGFVIGVLLLFMGEVFSIAGIVLIVAMVYLFPKLSIDYEYVFVDGQFDFDQITNKNKRKTLLRIDLDQVEMIAPENSHALDSYGNTKYEIKNYTSRDNSKKAYTIIANGEGKKYRILFEPDEKMLAMIKQKSPRKMAQN